MSPLTLVDDRPPVIRTCITVKTLKNLKSIMDDKGTIHKLRHRRNKINWRSLNHCKLSLAWDSVGRHIATVSLYDVTLPWADWAAWNLPGGPVGPPARWAATSNVEVGWTIFPVNRGRVGREWREGSEGQIYKENWREGGEENRAGNPWPLAEYLCLYSRVPSYATADRAGLPA